MARISAGSSSVLMESIRDGVALLTWQQDGFAYAESYDESAGRYRGLRAGHRVSIVERDTSGLLVEPGIARKQLEAETAAMTSAGPSSAASGADESGGSPGAASPGADPSGTPTAAAPPEPARPRRFHGSVTLDPTRVGRDASRIADEVIAHLAGLVGASVTVTLEIDAEVPGGAPEQVVRTVTENSRTLKFENHGFEKD
jgi:hypothetical protein